MKQNKVNAPKFIKANVHRCRTDIIFVIPRQEKTSEDAEKYLITLKDTGGWGYTHWEIDNAAKTDAIYCPYCGQLLIEEDTTD